TGLEPLVVLGRRGGDVADAVDRRQAAVAAGRGVVVVLGDAAVRVGHRVQAPGVVGPDLLPDVNAVGRPADHAQADSREVVRPGGAIDAVIAQLDVGAVADVGVERIAEIPVAGHLLNAAVADRLPVVAGADHQVHSGLDAGNV